MAKTADGNSYYYFEHQAKSRIDMKILALDDILGEYIGYALYFQSLEVMLELETPYLSRDSKKCAKSMLLTIDRYNEFIDAAITSQLFDITEDGDAYSPGFLKWFNKKQHARLAGSKGGKSSNKGSINDNEQD